MRAKCTHAPGSQFPDEILAIGNTPQTVFHVALNQDYTVYSMGMWQGVLHFLITNDDNHRPDWYPACLFKVVDSRLPSDWHFGVFGSAPEWSPHLIWGYAEMALDGGRHYLALIDREPEALRIFENRVSLAVREPSSDDEM